jgi:hypothetical protein
MAVLVHLPWEFWLALAVLLAVAGWGWSHRAQGWGLPTIAVCLTSIVWYHGDALYNDYLINYARNFSPQVLSRAWWQIILFALSLGLFVSSVPKLLNRKYAGNPSEVEALGSGRHSLAAAQPAIINLAHVLALSWAGILVVALWRTGGNLLGLVAPYFGNMAYPWARGQFAESLFDSIATLLGTISMICAASFGVFAAILRPGATRNLMILLIVASWPMFMLDRTRHVMLTVLLPGLLAYAFLRWRGHPLVQVTMVVASFLAMEAWFKFVIANRAETSVIAAVADKSQRTPEGGPDHRHLGLNMFEELCWINELLDQGRLRAANGGLYLVNLVNPIPRALWPGKPTMGLEYSILRGQQGDEISGTSATICVGMIGSGIVNFGQWFGPVVAAFLMSLWCAFLARLDLSGQDPGRLQVYLIGLVVTFNFGRDITFLVAYPFLFAYGLLWVWRQISPYSVRMPLPPGARRQRSRLGRCRAFPRTHS